MEKDLEQNIIEYIAALEQVNKQLVFALKDCLELLSRVQPSMKTQKGWQNILANIERVIRVGEKIVKKRPSH